MNKAGTGLSEQIRARLERTFREDDLDGPTREVRDAAVDLARRLHSDFGARWHESPRALKAFAAGLEFFALGYMPPHNGDTSLLNEIMRPDEEARITGRLRAADVQRDNEFPHLEAVERHAGRHTKVTKKGKKP